MIPVPASGLDAHMCQKPALIIAPVTLTHWRPEQLQEKKRALEQVIAIYRATCPDDDHLYLPYMRQSPDCPQSVVIGVLRLAGHELQLSEAAACLAALFSAWEQELVPGDLQHSSSFNIHKPSTP